MAWIGYPEPQDDSSRLGVMPFGPLSAPEFFRVANDPVVIEYLYGHREEWFRYEVLDPALNVLGELDAALTGGELEFNVYNDIRGTGSITTVDYDAFYLFEAPYPDPIDWMNRLVRITYCTPEFEAALITAIPQAPTKAHKEADVQMELELFDKTIKLQEDVFGYPYTVKKGGNLVAAIKTVFKSIGEPDANLVIDPSTKTSTTARTWPPETTKLRIINDLLDTLNYFAIYCDGFGRFRCEEYVKAASRGISFTFEYGSKLGLYLPELKSTRDIYSVPNKFIGIGVPAPPPAKPPKGWKEKPGPVKYAFDTKATSPFSYVSRGNRWITKVETDMAWTTEAELQATVNRRLASAQSVSYAVEDLRHPWLPFGMNDVVLFYNDRLRDVHSGPLQAPVKGVCRVQRINLYTGGLVTSTLSGLTDD